MAELCELHDAELAVEVHELRQAVNEMLTHTAQLVGAVNELVVFANRTDATLAGIRQMMTGAGPLQAIRLVGELRQAATAGP